MNANQTPISRFYSTHWFYPNPQSCRFHCIKQIWFHLLETSNDDSDSSVMTSCVNINTRQTIISTDGRQIRIRNCW